MQDRVRESFILYTEFYNVIKDLSDEQIGKLHRAIYVYQIEGVEIELGAVEKMAFKFIKIQLDKNKSKWEEEKQKRSQAGRMHKGNQYTQNGTNGTSVPKMEQMEECSKNGTNGTDNVNDNVNEDVNIEKEKVKEKVAEPPRFKIFKRPTIQEIDFFCKENFITIDAEKFFYHYESVGWKVGSKPMKDWKAAIRQWSLRDKDFQPKEKVLSKGTNQFLDKLQEIEQKERQGVVYDS